MNAIVPDLLSRLVLKWDRFTLDNGLRVVVHSDKRAPVVAVDVTYLVGAKDEGPGQSGLAHLVEHLMFTGTEALPGPFNARLIALGALDVNALTSNDASSYRNLVPTGMLEFVLYAEADRMGTLDRSLTPLALELQQAIVLQEKRERDQQPFLRSAHQIMKMAFPVDHPYRREVIGADADIAAATVDDARSWFLRFYRPSNAVLTICGDVDIDDVRPIVERYFASIPPGPALKREMTWVPTVMRKRHVRMEEPTAKATSLKLHWVCPGTTDPDIDLLELFLAYITSDNPGMLRDRLVIQDCLVTNVGTGVDRSGLLCCQASIDVLFDDPSTTPMVEAAIQSFLRRALDKPMDESILDLVKAARVNSWALEFRSLENRARALAFSESRFDCPDNHVTSSQRMMGAKSAEILAVARRWLSCAPMILEIVPFAPQVNAAVVTERAIPSAPAILTAPEHVVLPKVEHVTLSNGLKIVAATGFDCDTTAIRIVSDVGFADEQPTKRGLIAMVLDMWTKGAGNRNEDALRKVLESNSIIAPSGTTPTSVSLDLIFPLDATDTALDVLADLIVMPHFTAANLELRRDVVCKRLRQAKASRAGDPSQIIYEQLFGTGHRLTWSSSGTEGSVLDFDIESVNDCHRAIWDASKVTVFCAGGPSLDRLAAFFEKHAGRWPQDKNCLIEPISLPPPRPSTNSVAIIEAIGSDICSIQAGRLLPSHPESHLTDQAVCHALGGSVNSRLMHQLREVRGWAYGGGSHIKWLGRPGMDHMLAVDTSVRLEHAVATVTDLRNLMDAMAGAKPVTAQERDIFVADYKRTLHQVLRDPARLVGSMQRQRGAGVVLGGWGVELETLSNLTLESIRRSAESMLCSKGLSWTMTGDVAAIERQFATVSGTDEDLARWHIGMVDE